MERSLTEQVIEWKIGRVGSAEITKSVCFAVWKMVGGELSEDDRSEFILYFYRRIPGLLERYDPELGAFEAYLTTFVRYQVRSFRRLEARRRYKAFLVEDPEFWQNSGKDLQITVPSVEKKVVYSLPSPTTLLKEAAEAYSASNCRVHAEAFRKRLLFLTLKCSLFASEETLADLAPFLQLSVLQLRRLTEKLEESVERRESRRRILEERRNGFAWRLHALRKQLAAYPEEPRLTKLKRTADYYEKKCRALAEVIDHIPTCATNREIANVLNVPKGSVDSGIFYVRKLMRAQRNGSTLQLHEPAEHQQAGNHEARHR